MPCFIHTARIFCLSKICPDIIATFANSDYNFHVLFCHYVTNIGEKDKSINDQAEKLSLESISPWFKVEENFLNWSLYNPSKTPLAFLETFRKVSLDSGLIIIFFKLFYPLHQNKVKYLIS